MLAQVLQLTSDFDLFDSDQLQFFIEVLLKKGVLRLQLCLLSCKKSLTRLNSSHECFFLISMARSGCASILFILVPLALRN